MAKRPSTADEPATRIRRVARAYSRQTKEAAVLLGQLIRAARIDRNLSVQALAERIGVSRDLMQRIAPAGPVYQAGTLSGNPLAVAAGRAALQELSSGGAYETLERTGARLQTGIEEAGRRHGVPVRVERQGSMLGLFFTDQPIGKPFQTNPVLTRGDTVESWREREHDDLVLAMAVAAWLGEEALQGEWERATRDYEAAMTPRWRW